MAFFIADKSNFTFAAEQIIHQETNLDTIYIRLQRRVWGWNGDCFCKNSDYRLHKWDRSNTNMLEENDIRPNRC